MERNRGDRAFGSGLSKSKATEEKLEDRNGEVISLRDKYAEMQADLQERIATLTTALTEAKRRNDALVDRSQEQLQAAESKARSSR